MPLSETDSSFGASTAPFSDTPSKLALAPVDDNPKFFAGRENFEDSVRGAESGRQREHLHEEARPFFTDRHGTGEVNHAFLVLVEPCQSIVDAGQRRISAAVFKPWLSRRADDVTGFGRR